MNNKVTFEIQKLLEFYNNYDAENRKHISPITSMMGEELIARLFEYYQINKKENKCEIKYEEGNGYIEPTEGKNGKRLDCWIKVTENNDITCYQTEIKNWTTFTPGFRALKDDCDWKNKNYNKIFEGDKIKEDRVGKVLLEMLHIPETKNNDVKPLVCFWFPIDYQNKPDEYDDCFFPVKLSDNKEVYVFSASNYLRLLQQEPKETIDLKMPIFKKRQAILKNITQ